MLLVAIGWSYVVLMMAVAEATSPNGSVLGAFFTVLLYGVLALGIAMYLLGTPGRRARRRAALAASTAVASPAPFNPDEGGHPAGDAVATIRKEP
jgi:hypothetical protein